MTKKVYTFKRKLALFYLLILKIHLVLVIRKLLNGIAAVIPAPRDEVRSNRPSSAENPKSRTKEHARERHSIVVRPKMEAAPSCGISRKSKINPKNRHECRPNAWQSSFRKTVEVELQRKTRPYKWRTASAAVFGLRSSGNHSTQFDRRESEHNAVLNSNRHRAGRIRARLMNKNRLEFVPNLIISAHPSTGEKVKLNFSGRFSHGQHNYIKLTAFRILVLKYQLKQPLFFKIC